MWSWRLAPPALVVAGCLTYLPAQAAEWWLEPTIRGQTFYDDNFRLRSDREEGVWSVVVAPRLAGGGRTERAGAAFTAGAQFRRYSGESDLDSNDQDLHLDGYWQTERGELGLDADLVRDTTLTSELEETGFVQVRRRRTSSTLAPRWTHALNERDTVQVGYSYTDVGYDAPVTEFVDYDYQSLTGTWARRLDLRTRLHLQALWSRFEAPDIDSKTTTVGVQGGLEYALSERTTVSVLAGLRRSDAEFVARAFIGPLVVETEGETSSTGGLFAAELAHRFERGQIQASVTRSIEPGGFGDVYQSDQITLVGSYRLSERRRAGVTLQALRNEAVEGLSNARDRTYYRAAPYIEWDLTRQWRMRAEYMYRWQEYERAPEAADGSRVTLTLEHRWPRRSWSR